jgi:hypothetical protein
LQPGTRVMVRNLAKRPDLNGQIGVILQLSEKNDGRYNVRLPAVPTIVALLPEKFQLCAPVPAPSCPGTQPRASSQAPTGPAVARAPPPPPAAAPAQVPAPGRPHAAPAPAPPPPRPATTRVALNEEWVEDLDDDAPPPITEANKRPRTE